MNININLENKLDIEYIYVKIIEINYKLDENNEEN
jgi:hypothetical protein